MAVAFANNGLMVSTTGASITTSGASASANIPVDGSGRVPYYIRVAATAACYFRITTGASTAVATDMLIQPGDAVILAVQSCTVASALQVTAAGIVIITPLGNA